MRIALLSDIHGNPIALDAVLADIQARGGVNGYWILGDLCAIGYDPVTVLERLAKLPNATFIRGNADRYIVTGETPPPTYEECIANPQLLPVLVEVAGSLAWTQGYVEARGWLPWVGALPLEQRFTLPDGTRVLLVHAAPGTDDGWGLNLSLTNDALEAEIDGCEADLICVGHFHMQMDRTLNGTRIINPGSISNNFAPDLRAGYAILTLTEDSYRVSFYRVQYDFQQVRQRIERSSNPGKGYLLSFLEGRVRAGWLDHWDQVSHYPLINEG